MKVGILTFHCAYNYGAVLQAYALQQTIKSLDIDVEIVDYQPDFIRLNYALFPLKKFNQQNWKGYIVDRLIRLSNLPNNIVRQRVFEHFIHNYLQLSLKQLRSVTDFRLLDHDVYLCGSDQIWNPNITHGLDPVYFGSFPTSKSHRNVSYAASIGVVAFKDPAVEATFKELLANIDIISIRERQASDFVRKYTSNPVSCVLDPVFLLGKREWEKIVTRPTTNGKFLLVYKIMPTENLYDVAYTIAKKYGLEIIEIVNEKHYLNSRCKHKQIFGVSPTEFLGYIHSADFVVAASFHGMAFSLLFQKDFCVLPHPTTGARMISLAADFGISHQIVNSIDDVKTLGAINYDSVGNAILAMKNQSLSFLRDALTSGINTGETHERPLAETVDY